MNDFFLEKNVARSAFQKHVVKQGFQIYDANCSLCYGFVYEIVFGASVFERKSSIQKETPRIQCLVHRSGTGVVGYTLLQRQRSERPPVVRRRTVIGIVTVAIEIVIRIRQSTQVDLVGLSRGGGPPSPQRSATAGPAETAPSRHTSV